MDARPSSDPRGEEHWTAVATEYRVVIWEKPDVEGIDPEQIGWGEATFDLTGARDVHEAIEGARQKLASNEGPYSRGGKTTLDREYVLYVKVPDRDGYLQIAGSDPTRDRHSKNLRRVG